MNNISRWIPFHNSLGSAENGGCWCLRGPMFGRFFVVCFVTIAVLAMDPASAVTDASSWLDAAGDRADGEQMERQRMLEATDIRKREKRESGWVEGMEEGGELHGLLTLPEVEPPSTQHHLLFLTVRKCHYYWSKASWVCLFDMLGQLACPEEICHDWPVTPHRIINNSLPLRGTFATPNQLQTMLIGLNHIPRWFTVAQPNLLKGEIRFLGCTTKYVLTIAGWPWKRPVASKTWEVACIGWHSQCQNLIDRLMEKYYKGRQSVHHLLFIKMKDGALIWYPDLCSDFPPSHHVCKMHFTYTPWLQNRTRSLHWNQGNDCLLMMTIKFKFISNI